MGWQRAPATNFTKQKISFPTLNIREPGYLFVYLSYEDNANVPVYFDDMKITHTKTNVIQYNEYYPFGLQAATSWTREDSKNNFLYNAGSELNTTSGWYETFFRGFDPTLGRFMQVDPLAEQNANLSGYNYGNNNPIFFNDPLGDKVYYDNGEMIGSPEWFRQQTDQVAAYAQAVAFFQNWAIGIRNLSGGGGGNSGSSQMVSGFSTSNPDEIAKIIDSFLRNDGQLKFGRNEQGYSGLWVDYALPASESSGGVGSVFMKFGTERTQQQQNWDLDNNGKLSLEEANNWYRTGNGVAISVNLNSIDFSNVYVSDVSKNNGFVNLFVLQGTVSQRFFDAGGSVYGTIRLEIVDGLTVKTPDGYFDIYDFDVPHPFSLNPATLVRNIGTWWGEASAGEGRPFNIRFVGTALLGGYERPQTTK